MDHIILTCTMAVMCGAESVVSEAVPQIPYAPQSPPAYIVSNPVQSYDVELADQIRQEIYNDLMWTPEGVEAFVRILLMNLERRTYE